MLVYLDPKRYRIEAGWAARRIAQEVPGSILLFDLRGRCWYAAQPTGYRTARVYFSTFDPPARWTHRTNCQLRYDRSPQKLRDIRDIRRGLYSAERSNLQRLQDKTDQDADYEKWASLRS